MKESEKSRRNGLARQARSQTGGAMMNVRQRSRVCRDREESLGRQTARCVTKGPKVAHATLCAREVTDCIETERQRKK